MSTVDELRRALTALGGERREVRARRETRDDDEERNEEHAGEHDDDDAAVRSATSL